MSNKFIPAAKFHILTPIFDSLCSFIGLGRKYRDEVIATLPIKGNERLKVLDAGCGTGSLAIQLKKEYPQIELCAIDIDSSILQRAIKKSKKEKVDISFKKAPMQDTRFQENYFDIVYTSLVFHHLKTEDKREAIKEISRITKKGGTIVVSDFAKPRRWVHHIIAWFTILLEEGWDNYKGRIPILLEEQFKQTKTLKRYGLIEILQTKK